MRFPVPDRLPIQYVGLFAGLVVVGQQLEATDLTFSMLSGTFILLFALAYNAAGGLFFPSGAWIFFNGMLSAVVGLVYKIFLGEPGQTHLLTPNKTMLVYCSGMAVVAAVAAASQRLRRREPLLGTISDLASMKRAAIGCLVIGAVVQIVTYNDFASSGSWFSALRQLNQLPRMAIILGVTYEILQSKGRRSSNWVVWCAGLLIFVYGVINFSKEGIFVPVFTWLVPAIALGFDFSKRQLVGGVLVLALMVHYLVPFSQLGRRSRDDNGDQYLQLLAAVGYLEHLGATRLEFLETVHDAEDDEVPHLYDAPQALFDREQMLAVDDALIDTTDRGHVFGIKPSLDILANLAPHFLWKEKPFFLPGNDYGREINILSPGDLTTSISFSPVADAYHEATWFGVFFLLPLVTFCYFLLTDSLTGSARRSPWALLPIAVSSHVAPEGMLQGTGYQATWGLLVLVVVVFLCRTALPFLVTQFFGRGKASQSRGLEFGREGDLEPQGWNASR